MSGFDTIGKLLVVIGGVLVLLGGLLWLGSKLPFLGHLPGDIRIERPGFTCLIPLASSIILSILLTILLNVVIQVVRFLIHRGP
jgi:hypothetical protein